jgi:hypothetical protein
MKEDEEPIVHEKKKMSKAAMKRAKKGKNKQKATTEPIIK